MKRSNLSKAVGAGVVTFNLVMLSLALPVSAQTSTPPGSSNSGTGTAPGDATTGTSPAPGEPQPPMGASPAPGEPQPPMGASPAPGEPQPPMGDSPAPSESPTATTPQQENTPAARGESQSSWGWLGLLGLIGLASLFRKPVQRSGVGLTSNEQLRTSTHSTNARLHQGVAQAEAGARNFWGELKADVDGFKERRANAQEIKRIKGALGRSVNRIILDKQDNIILNVGDLITHQAIERARQADMLDVLLDSVADLEPELVDGRSVPVSGEASLEEREQDNTINR